MKKTLALVITLVLTLFLVTGCNNKKENEIVVGASSTPHAEILEQLKEPLKQKGFELKIVVYDDYILPNKALSDGTLDANFFQHTPYLDSYNSQNGTDLVSVFKVHYEPFGIYGNGVTSLDGLASGATILIPADDSNETRALLLLKQVGLVELKEGKTVLTGITTLDIVDDKGYNIVAVQADTVTSQLRENSGAIAIVNGNYALEAGLKVSDALALEDSKGDAAQTYGNVIAVKPADKDNEKIKALIDALNTKEISDWIKNEYKGAVVPLF